MQVNKWLIPSIILLTTYTIQTKQKLTGYDILLNETRFDCNAVECTNHYIPICGVDGYTHTNSCIAQCVYGVRKARNGACDKDALCNCSFVYAPVCGANGSVYENICYLECNNVKKIRDGKCSEKLIKTCDCPRTKTEVCGKDGVTYMNECAANCTGVQIVSQTRCQNNIPENSPNVKSSINSVINFNNNSNSIQNIGTNSNKIDNRINSGIPCGCQSQYTPVCGSDNQTYGNECLARCNKIERLKHNGECKNCNCSTNYEPVCTSDSETYPNSCTAQCNGKKIVSQGVCYIDPACKCTAEINPVCGKDRENYTNPCWVACRKTEVAYSGKCKDPAQCNCSFEFSPVCGFNGITYPNMCEAECDDSKIAYPGVCTTNNNMAQPIVENVKGYSDINLNGSVCRCEDIVKPVCGVDNTQYKNACDANCKGVKIAFEDFCTNKNGRPNTISVTPNVTPLLTNSAESQQKQKNNALTEAERKSIIEELSKQQHILSASINKLPSIQLVNKAQETKPINVLQPINVEPVVQERSETLSPEERARQEAERRRLDQQLEQLVQLQFQQAAKQGSSTQAVQNQASKLQSQLDTTMIQNQTLQSASGPVQQIQTLNPQPISTRNTNQSVPAQNQQPQLTTQQSVLQIPLTSAQPKPQDQNLNIIPSVGPQNMTQINSQLDKIMQDFLPNSTQQKPQNPPQNQAEGQSQKSDIIQDAIGSLKIDPAIQSQADLDMQIQALMRLLTPPPQLQNSNCNCDSRIETVCGTDGVTYVNSCVARCLQVEVVRKGGC